MNFRHAALLWLVLFGAAGLQAQPAEIQKGFRPLAAALHIHSQYSDGEFAISSLGSMAQERQLDVIGFTDSFLTRVRYGVGPFKKLISKSINRRSVMDSGLDSYFDSIEKAQQEIPDVVMIPGFEVAPYYYWQGQWPGNLELHDFDRHMLVFGIQDRKALRNLPVIENATWSNTNRSLMLAAGPAIVLLSGLLIASLGVVAGRRTRYRVIAGLLFIAGAAWAYDAYPFGELSDPYSGKPDYHAFQRVIDYVDTHGGLAFWSYPEARYPDIQTTGARMVSRGQPEILGLTDKYSGFEGLYGDTITITGPGNLWDQMLLEYLRGDRKTWPSVITGIDFHSLNPHNNWFQLDHGLTILFATEKKDDAVIEAMKLGARLRHFPKRCGAPAGARRFRITSERQSGHIRRERPNGRCGRFQCHSGLDERQRYGIGCHRRRQAGAGR